MFRERINHGIWLYKKKYAKKLLLTGGKSQGNSLADSVIAKRYAEKYGVAGNDILVEEKSRTTEENLYYAKRIIVKNILRKVIIVSDPLHMKRAMRIAHDYHLDAYPSPTPTSQYKGWKSKFIFSNDDH